MGGAPDALEAVHGTLNLAAEAVSERSSLLVPGGAAAAKSRQLLASTNAASVRNLRSLLSAGP